jgi:hypothetical protein
MVINIKIEKKDLWLFAAVMVFLVAAGYVIAYNPNWQTNAGNPAVMGHTPDEIIIMNGSGTNISLANYTAQINQTISRVIDKDGNINITQGTWCGLKMSAHTVPISTCGGHNPQVSCPKGYTSRLFANMGDLGGNWYTCFKN